MYCSRVGSSIYYLTRAHTMSELIGMSWSLSTQTDITHVESHLELGIQSVLRYQSVGIDVAAMCTMLR